jgi:hypothetical protein
MNIFEAGHFTELVNSAIAAATRRGQELSEEGMQP